MNAKVRMFVIEGNSTVKVRNATANIQKGTDFDFATIDQASDAEFEDVSLNVIDTAGLEKIIKDVFEITDRTLNLKTNNFYRDDLLGTLGDLKNTESPKSRLEIFGIASGIAADWCAIVPSITTILSPFLQ